MAVSSPEENTCCLMVYRYTSGLDSWEMTNRLGDVCSLTIEGTYPSVLIWYSVCILHESVSSMRARTMVSVAVEHY